MQPIKMVDLRSQYLHIRREVDEAIQNVLESTDFIQGSSVKAFEQSLSRYIGGSNVISCGNGTDALQITMMALDFKPRDEVILPVHTYVATAEVIALLKLVPVFADVNEGSFTIDATKIEKLITKKTVAIVPVHLYGQCADMLTILSLAKKYNLHVIEDAAQALGTDYIFPDGSLRKAGTLGIIGTTSFFPSKSLGAFGDGGALFTEDVVLAEKIRMIANHGQKQKYHHDLIGVNSRLDTLQAAILNVKLGYLDSYVQRRRKVAEFYDLHLKDVKFLKIPARVSYSSHVFHQYTLLVEKRYRDALKSFLQDKGVPTAVYYPIPLHFQLAYINKELGAGSFPVSERLSGTVLCLPSTRKWIQSSYLIFAMLSKCFIRL